MSFVCDRCERTIDAQPEITVTGRELCMECNDQLHGLAAGVIAAGPNASIGQQVTDGLVTAGLFARLRAWRRGGR